MKEHELYDRLDLAQKRLNLRPVSCILNILTFSYLLLLNKFDELMDLANTYSMTTSVPCILCENFRTLVSIEKKDIKSSELQIKYALSVDPEDYANYLFTGLIEMTKGVSGEDYFKKALSLTLNSEKTRLSETLKVEDDQLFKEIARPPEYMTNEQIERLRGMVSSEPNNPIYKVSLAEAYFKKRDFRSSEWLLQSVISIYPYYPRALYILSRINEEYKNDIDTSVFYLKKIFMVNPLSEYAVKKEVFLDDKEMIDLDELIYVFKDDDPIVKHFIRKYEEIRSEIEENLEKRKEERKEYLKTFSQQPAPSQLKQTVTEEATKNIRSQSEKSLQFEDALHKLREKKYKEALGLFIELSKVKTRQ